MDTKISGGGFENISQRVASSYRRMLAEFHPVLAEGQSPEQQRNMASSQADLHAFFACLYDALFTAPVSFGLPVDVDQAIRIENKKDVPNKDEMLRILHNPRKLVQSGLEFLYAAGKDGRLEDKQLILDSENRASSYLKKKSGKTWLKGLSSEGMVVSESSDTIILSNSKFPNMMPALQALAQSCAKCAKATLGMVFFCRCDFHAIKQNFEVEALDLFRVFKPDDYAWAIELHNYFTSKQYQAQAEIYHIYHWIVKYQGQKSIKSTPLFQIWFDERYSQQLRAGVKCVSSQRIVPVLPSQSQALQADFDQRALTCGNCHWCDSQKTLGPVEYAYRDSKRKICWYVPSDIWEYTPETISLVQEYEQMHEALTG